MNTKLEKDHSSDKAECAR